MLASATAKQRPPNSACTGAAVEMMCAGGEMGFVTRLVDESALERARQKVQWFTTMLGRLASVGEVVEVLRRKRCGNWAVAEFVQGQKTRRWAVGWSWGDRRPAGRVARGTEGMGLGVERRWLPFPSEFAFEVGGEGGSGSGRVGLEEVGGRVDREVEALRLRWQWKGPVAQGLGMADGDVWSRKARRRTKNEKAEEIDEDEDEDEDGEPALVFKISLSMSQSQGAGGVLVDVRWLQGKDAVLFESFCGWLKRKVGDSK